MLAWMSRQGDAACVAFSFAVLLTIVPAFSQDKATKEARLSDAQPMATQPSMIFACTV
jgi:hypothetical protein